jgi:hypothetical protein
MKKNVGMMVLAFSLLATAASAQKLKGKIDFLKGIERVNIVFDFEGLTINGKSEASFVELLKEEKTAEIADDWKSEWENSQRERFKTSYMKGCNDKLNNGSIGVFPEAQYTIVVKIEDIDPGVYAGPFSRAAKIKSTVSFAKTGEEAILASYTSKDYNNAGNGIYCPPLRFDRIDTGFNEAGEKLGKVLNKNLK